MRVRALEALAPGAGHRAAGDRTKRLGLPHWSGVPDVASRPRSQREVQ